MRLDGAMVVVVEVVVGGASRCPSRVESKATAVQERVASPGVDSERIRQPRNNELSRASHGSSSSSVRAVSGPGCARGAGEDGDNADQSAETPDSSRQGQDDGEHELANRIIGMGECM